MWLLDTRTASLHHFDSPEFVAGGYAILSHVWGVQEQTFQDIHALQRGLDGLSFVSAKIRGCCLRAAKDGFRWVWIDTCCIDKTSSTELSEAINSMFSWYSQARVCYAYLADIPASDKLDAADSSFRQSRWFTRGWTLQELIAPRSIVFLSQDRSDLGTKASLASLVEDITGVDTQVLVGALDVTRISVARRMWWASKRTTTRVEDVAYALMGLFDVHMPTIYGEGTQAFLRLQMKIFERCSDQSIFAWGECATSLPAAHLDRSLAAPYPSNAASHLLAPSPAFFSAFSGRIRPVLMGDAADAAIDLVHAHNHWKGALSALQRKARCPSLPSNGHLPQLAAANSSISSQMLLISDKSRKLPVCIAVLACSLLHDLGPGTSRAASWSKTPVGIGLLLHRDASSDSLYRRYHVGIALQDSSNTCPSPHRLILLTNATFEALRSNTSSHVLRTAWELVYFSQSHAGLDPVPSPPKYDLSSIQHVHLPHSFIAKLAEVGFVFADPGYNQSGRIGNTRTPPMHPGTVFVVYFCHRAAGMLLAIRVGRCEHDTVCAHASIDVLPALQKRGSLWTALFQAGLAYGTNRNLIRITNADVCTQYHLDPVQLLSNAVTIRTPSGGLGSTPLKIKYSHGWNDPGVLWVTDMIADDQVLPEGATSAYKNHLPLLCTQLARRQA
ncbi:HET-domain-containing protein [Trametes cingulata]|nr:HET-domain-containing protein [Trametes cingulata]